MSKLITRLNDLNKVAMPAMGFQKAAAQERPASVAVLAELTGKTEEMVKTVSETAIDAGVLDASGLTAAALSKYMKNRGEMAIGLNLSAGKNGAGLKLVNGDIDFVIFDKDFPVNAFEGKDMESTGKILKLDLQIEPSLLRAAHGLYPSVDAIMIDMRVASLTIESLMTCKKVSEFTGLHVITMVNKALSAVEIRALREAGIKGIMPGPDASADDLKTVLEIIKALPKPEKRKDIKSVPLLPRQGIASASPEKEDGGDEEDE